MDLIVFSWLLSSSLPFSGLVVARGWPRTTLTHPHSSLIAPASTDARRLATALPCKCRVPDIDMHSPQHIDLPQYRRLKAASLPAEHQPKAQPASHSPKAGWWRRILCVAVGRIALGCVALLACEFHLLQCSVPCEIAGSTRRRRPARALVSEPTAYSKGAMVSTLPSPSVSRATESCLRDAEAQDMMRFREDRRS